MRIMQSAANDIKRQHRSSTMPHSRLRPRLGLAAGVAAWVAVVLLLARATSSAAAAWRAAGWVRPEDAVTVLAGATGLLLSGWLALATLVSFAAVLRPASRIGRVSAAAAARLAPAGLRRAVVLAVGVGLLGAAPAVAAPVRTAGPFGLAGQPVATVSAASVSPGALSPAWGLPAEIAPKASPPPITVPGPAATDAPRAVTRSGSVSLDPGWVPAPPPASGATASASASASVATTSGTTASATRTTATTKLPTVPVAAVSPAPTRQADLPGPRPRALEASASASPATDAVAADAQVPGSVAGATAEVVVRRGDCLWDLAAARLGPAATAAEISAEWRRWYQTNRAVIGPDPDRLRPGQRLRPPPVGPGSGTGSTEGGRS
jgi:hypothetical protein